MISIGCYIILITKGTNNLMAYRKMNTNYYIKTNFLSEVFYSVQ